MQPRPPTFARIVATLVPPKPDTVVTVEGTAFKRGADAYDKGQWADAEVFFTTVIRVDSTSADAYYDRALVRAIQDHRDAAADDYERYLRLRPEALDRALVVARVNQLRAQRLSASQAFGLGVVIPGGGQFYTRRPVRGLLSLAGVGAAAAFAMTETKTSDDDDQDGERSIRQPVQLFGHDGAQESPVSRARPRRRRRHRALQRDRRGPVRAQRSRVEPLRLTRDQWERRRSCRQRQHPLITGCSRSQEAIGRCRF